MRHHFNIVRVVGLILFGFGVFIAGIAFPELIDRITYDGTRAHRSLWNEAILSYFLVGLFLMIVGIAGLLKARWFPIWGTIGVIATIVMISWFAFVTVKVQSLRKDDFFIVAGLLVLVYSSMITLILILQNEYFGEALQNEEEGNVEDDQILDA